MTASGKAHRRTDVGFERKPDRMRLGVTSRRGGLVVGERQSHGSRQFCPPLWGRRLTPLDSGFRLTAGAGFLVSRPLRSHQRVFSRIVDAMAAGQAEVRDILAGRDARWRQVAAASDRGRAPDRGRRGGAGVLGGPARQPAASGGGGLRRPSLARRRSTTPCPCAPPTTRPTRAAGSPATSRPTRRWRQHLTCTWPSFAASARCWWSTRCTTCRRWPRSTLPLPRRWRRAQRTWRARGRVRCCRSSSARRCACC